MPESAGASSPEGLKARRAGGSGEGLAAHLIGSWGLGESPTPCELNRELVPGRGLS